VVLGDVVICPEVAAGQVAGLGRSVDDELALLVVHGVLHLLGYDHAEDEEGATMRRREQELLSRFAAITPAEELPGLIPDDEPDPGESPA